MLIVSNVLFLDYSLKLFPKNIAAFLENCFVCFYVSVIFQPFSNSGLGPRFGNIMSSK